MDRRRWLKRVIGFALITLILVGCGGPEIGPTATPTVPPSPTPHSPEAILEMTAISMDDLESYHFEMVVHMTIVSGGTTVESPLIFTGDFQAPDRFQGELTLDMLGQSIEVEIIIIGEMFYITDPTSGDWLMSEEAVTPFTPQDFVGLEPSDLANMEGLTLLGENVLDGVPVYHLEGKLAAEAMELALGEAGGEVKAEFWIGVEDGWIRQANLEMEFVQEGDELAEVHATVFMTFSEFNKEIVIEAP